MERLIRRAFRGLARRSPSARRSAVVQPDRLRPYLEPLEPRILLSADVGLVPDALLAPPFEALDPRDALEPAIHDEVLVREPSRFEDVAHDPSTAGEVLRSRIWEASLADRGAVQETRASQVVIVDSRVAEVESLLEALLDGTDEAVGGEASVSSSSTVVNRSEALARSLADRGIAVVVLDAERDGLDQLGEIARTYQGVGAIHVVSHGSSGRLELGDTRVTTATLLKRADSLADLREALGPEGDLLLYGCEVAEGEVGIEFVTTLAGLSGVDVAASSDLTGAASLGGDWDLEFATGTIEAATIRAPGFESVLVDFALANPGSSGAVDVSLSFDPTLGPTGQGLWVLESNQPFLDQAGASQTRIEFSEDVSISISTGAADDVFRLLSVDPAFTGQIVFDAGAGDDVLSHSGFQVPADAIAVLLAGGDGDDRYVFETGAEHVGRVTVDEGPAAGSDTLVYPAGFEAFTSGSLTLVDQANVEAVELALSQDAIDALIDGLGAFADWADRLDEEADLGAALAGIFGNADVGVGTALDLGEAFEQLKLEIASSPTPVTANDLRDLFEGLERRGVEHLDRTLLGEVIGTGFSNTEAFGLTLALDDGDVFRLGLAATSGTPGELIFGVRLTGQGDPSLPEITFARETNNAITVRRASGDWKADGFRAGQRLRLAESLKESPGPGSASPTIFEIASVSGDGLVLTLEETEDESVFDAFLATDPTDPTSRIERTIDPTATDPTITVANTIFRFAAVPTDELDWRDAGFRVDQAILATFEDGSEASYTVDSLSEDGLVLTVREPVAFRVDGLARVTGRPIVAAAGPGGSPAAGTLPALVRALNAAIDESDLSGRVRALSTDLDEDGSPTASTRLGFQVLDTQVRDFALEWTDGPRSEVGFDLATASGSNLVDELKGLGELDVRVGGVYRLATFVPETSDLVPIQILDASATPVLIEDFTGSSTGALTFSADPDGKGRLVRSVSEGAWDPIEYVIDRVITIAHDPANPSAEPNANDGSFRIVAIEGVDGRELVLERLVSISETAPGSGSGSIVRTNGSWIDEGFVIGDTIEVVRTDGVTGVSTTRRFQVTNLDESTLGIAGADFTNLGGFVAVDAIRREDAVALSFDPGTGTLSLDFTFLAKRTSSFSVGLGREADEKGLALDPSASVDLESALSSQLTISLALSGTPTFSIGVDGLSVSGEVNVPDSAAAVPGRNIAAGTTANIGFLGAEVGAGGASLSLAAELDLPSGWTPLTTAELEAESGAILAARALDLERIRESFDLDFPILVTPGLDVVGSGGTFSVADLGIFTSATLFAESVFDGVESLLDPGPGGETPFQNFDEVEAFANIDAQGLLRLLNEIRTGLQRISQSELVTSFDVPFVGGTLDGVVDLADAFGDALLYDDGDDGLDRDDDTFLVTDLNAALADAGLGDFVEFRVVDLEATPDSGDRTFELFAIDPSVTKIEIRGVGPGGFFGFAASSFEGSDPKLTGVSTFDPDRGRLEADQAAEIEITRTTGVEVATIALSVADTADNEKVGNDVAKLLDANNVATFDTAQELKAKLADLALDAAGVEGLAFDSAANILTWEIDLSNELLSEAFPVAFDLDLGPLGNVETVDDPEIRIGGSVGFKVGFGIDLSREPNGQAGIDDATELTDLRGIDQLSDLIKTNPSITARGRADATEIEEDGLEILLDRIRMSGAPSLTFNAGEALDVSADTLVNNLVYLAAPDGYEIVLDDGSGPTPTGFRQASLRVPPRAAPTVEDDGRLTFTTPELDFTVRLDLVDGVPARVLGDPFGVMLAAQTYTVSSERVFKSRWLRDIERAIKSAQEDRAANSMTRGTGSFVADGFAVGQIIEIKGSRSNDGFYEIESVTDDTIGLVQDLAAAGTEEGIEIEGPGIVIGSTADAFASVEAGEMIQIAGSIRNDGLYLVDSKVDDATLVLSSALDPEPASGEIVLVDSGASVRLDSADGDASFRLRLSGETFDVVLPVAADPADPFAPNTADNETLTDLVQDMRSALSRATDSNGNEVDLRNRVEVGLDGTRLVLTLSTGELASDTALSFVSTGSNSGTITRSGAGDDDPSGSWSDDGFETGQLIRIRGSSANDGLYRIVATDPDDETVISVERVDSAATIVDSPAEEGIEVTGQIARVDPGTALSFSADGTLTRTAGSFLAEGFEVGQLIVIERAGANDGTYRINQLTATALGLGDPDTGAAVVIAGGSLLSDVLVSGSFRMTEISQGARALGFGSPADSTIQSADLHDFVVVDSNGNEYLVSLDGATTVGDVLRRIEEAAGGDPIAGLDRIRARIAEDGTGIELIERGQLTGMPGLTFESIGNRIVRSEGDWSDDGFAIGDTIRLSGTALNDGDFVVSDIQSDAVGGPSTILVLTTAVRDEGFVRDVEVVNLTDGFVRGGEDFRVELVNGSVAALGLGILRSDAESDANTDGTIDLADRDGVIEGGAIGGSSLFDRIFIRDPTLSANLFLEPSSPDGFDIVGDFGFFEAGLNANGRFVTEVSLTLEDPGTGIDADGKITLREFATGLEDIRDFIEVPRFAGNGLDDAAGSILFSNEAGSGRITRQNGGWDDDGFRAGQKVTLRNANGRDGDYLIDRLESSVAGGANDILVLAEALPDGDSPDAIPASGALEVVAAIGTFVLEITQADLGGFADFAALGDDAAVVLTLYDFGDPFFRETVGPDSKAGGSVGFDAIDRIRVVRGTGDASVDTTLTELRDRLANRDELRAEITYTTSGSSDEETVSAEITQVDADGRIHFDEDLVDDIDGLTILKVRFTNPARTEIETPDLGNLLDFQDISFLDVIRGLQLASDFLGQFEAFGFLEDPLPVLDVSFNDLLDYGEDFALAVEEFQRNPAASLQALEARLEAVLGIDDGTDSSLGQDPFDVELSYATEDLAGASIGETRGILRIDFVVGSQFNESLGVEFDLGGEGVLAGAAGLQASGAAEIRIALGLDISETVMRGDPALVFRRNAGLQDDEIERLDGFSFLDDGFLPGQTIRIEGTTRNDGNYEILDIVNGGQTLVLKDELGASEGTEGVGLSGVALTGARSISLFDDTEITARFDAGADDVSFRAAVGPLGVFIQDGRVELGGRIAADPGTPAGDPMDIFRVGVDFDRQRSDGRTSIFATGVSGDSADPYQRQLVDVLLRDIGDSFSAELAGGLDVALPVFFPNDSIEKGSVEFDVGLALSSENGLETTGGEVEFFKVGTPGPVAFSDLFDLGDLLDLGQFSLFDNVLLAIDGFDLFLGGLQDVLDGEVFGIQLPLIGDSLSDGARFIEDLREDFVEPFRDRVEDTESFVAGQEDPDRNVLSQILFDLLAPTGLLLVTRDADGNALAEEDVFTARAENLVRNLEAELGDGEFFLSQVIQLDGTRRNAAGDFFEADGSVVTEGEIDIAGIPTANLEELAFLEWDFRLGQRMAAVDTDIALDFGLPALGLEADGAIGLELGWDLELGFGLNFQDGFYFDIGSADELEIEIDVVLPDSLTGRLAFLQLDAINSDSGLGASFAIDVVNETDAGDDRLGFGELGKLGLETGLAAEARALLDLQLKLNDELLADFASVFPTVLAEFEFDWGIGSRGGVRLGFDASSGGQGTITRAVGSFATDGYMVDQRIRISGTDGGINDGAYRILEVRDDELVVELSGSQTFAGLSDQAGVTIFVDPQSLSGSVLSDGLRLVEFRNVGLDLGSFITDFAQPVLGEIQKITGPIQPIIEILTSPLPVISDLGPPVTLLDLARSTGFLNPALIEAIADIVTLVNAIPTDVSSIVIPFGDFTIFDRADASTMSVDPTDPDADLSRMNEQASGDDRSLESKLDEQDRADPSRRGSTNFVRQLANTRGFAFPILTDPSQIFGLLTGQEVVLFGYDMPPLEFDFSFSQSYPVYGPLAIGVFGNARGRVDFAFGFDSSGLERFFETGSKNPLLIFDGFFVSDNPEDVTGAGPDLPELEFDLEFGLSAGLELGIARAGVAGGIGAEIDFDLFDPNRDGKIRVGEILENIENEFLFGEPVLSPLAVFDVSGLLTARAFAFLEINLLLFDVDLEFNITPRITLVDFDVDFTRVPKLATELDDGTLQLNMGEFSEARLNGDLRDGDERFVVESVSDGIRVTWLDSNPGGPDFSQTYRGDFTRILARAGEGNDLIDASGVRRAGIRFEFDGGAGDDRILAGQGLSSVTSELRGGDGADEIVGSDGADLIFGEAGRDRILGRAGDDVIFADGGRRIESGARVRNASLVLFAGSGSQGAVIERRDGGSFVDDGLLVGQTLEIGDSESGSEGVYRVGGVEEGRLTLTTDEIFGPREGGPVPLSGTIESESIEIRAVDSEFLNAYQVTATATDGDDAVAGGLGDDWIFGAGGSDWIIGGEIGDPTAESSSLQLDRLLALLNGSNSEEIDATSDAAGEDVLIGDGGRIRLRRDGSLREVTDTDRGFVFGDDRIFGSGGVDRLHGGRGDDVIRGGDGEDVIFGESGFDRLYGEAGRDTIFGGRDGDVIEGGADDDHIEGEQGSDLLRGGTGDDRIFGQAGVDTLFGESGEDMLDGGSDPDVLFGGYGDDDLDGGAGDDVVFGDVGGPDFSDVESLLSAELVARLRADVEAFEGALDSEGPMVVGEDSIRVRGGSDRVDGQDGSDRYTVSVKGGENSARMSVFDSGSSVLDTDRLTINGTAGDDQFLLRAATDPDGLAFVASINRGDDVERIDYDELEVLVVNGLFGDDRFALDDLRSSATLNGGGGDDFFQVGQLYRARRTNRDGNVAIEDEFTTTETTRGFLSNGISAPATLNGGNDNDEFIVFRNLAPLQINGQDGDDAITVRAFALVDPADRLQEETLISGGGGADTIRYAVNAPVNIDGGDGLDSVTVIGTEFADEFVVTRDGVFGAGLNVNFVNVEFLKVDGAEGDDRFYIESTNEAILTEVVGGLGSDTFQVADGVERAVTSNDLLGHSGLILHDLESNDPVYQGPEGLGIDVPGLSADIGDADEPGIVISERNGFTRIAEGGALDWYTIVLTRRPEREVFVKALAPQRSPEENGRGELSFGVFSAGNNERDGSGTTLVFDETNWFVPQRVWVHATSSATAASLAGLEDPFAGAVFDLDDGALEGERFGVIQHLVTSDDTRTGLIEAPEAPFVDDDGDLVTTVVLDGEFDTEYTLVGRLFEIVSAPAGQITGGLGQSLLVKSSETIAGSTRLTLFGAFDPEDLPLEGSRYRIAFYDGLQIPNVTVQIDDNDAADVILTETEDLRVFERSPDQTGGIQTIAAYEVELSRGPRNGETIFVDLQVTSANGEPDQLLLFSEDPSLSPGVVGSGTIRLEFRADTDDPLAWNRVRTVFVQAIDDAAREGFHRGLIEHSVTTRSGLDVDEVISVDFETISLIDGLGQPGTAEFVLLSRLPVQFRGDVREATSDTIAGFDDVSFSIDDLARALDGDSLEGFVVRITKGPGAGQLRRVVSIEDGVVTVAEPWETVPDETSRFSVSRIVVSVDGETLDPERYVVNGSTIVFLDAEGAVEERTASTVGVSYGYLDRGYEGRVEERLSVRVVDNDTAGVVVLESDSSTRLIEVGPNDQGREAIPDVYQIVLSRPPGQIDPLSDESPFDSSDGPAFVEVIVEPGPTLTSRGDLVRGRVIEPGGPLVGETQVEVRASQAQAPGSRIDEQGRLVLVFTAENWNVPQTVEVVAKADEIVDGGDTKVFAPKPSTLIDIQGPLLIDGAGGQGSLEGLTPPVLLPDANPETRETNLKVPTGDVLDASSSSLTVDSDSLRAYLVDRGLSDPSSLLGRTVEIVRGPGIDQFREIVGVEVLGDETRLDIAPTWNLDGAELAEVTAYKITRQSLNFFVDESEQQDLVFVHDEDSPADSRGRMTALDFDLFPEMVSIINGQTAPGDPEFIVPDRLVGFGMGPDTEIARGLRPGGITYSNLEGFELDLGFGNNTLEIDSVQERRDEVRTFTRIRTGRGNDQVSIAVAAPGNPTIGRPFVEVDLGLGDDTVDASGSTLGLDLVGGFGDDLLIGGDGNDLIYGDFGSLDFVVTDRRPIFQESVSTLRPEEGGNDTIEGGGGDDRLFGGAGDDLVRGGDGSDALFGDYGRVTVEEGFYATIETTEFFRGGVDFVDGGPGNDFLFGGAQGDGLRGNFERDLIVGEYGRLRFRGGVPSSFVRFGQGSLDLAASSFVGLYDPTLGAVPPVEISRTLEGLSVPPPSDPEPVSVSGLVSSRRTNDGFGRVPGEIHRVVPGDSLWRLAERELGDPFRWTEILALNRDVIDDPDLIEPGQELDLPVDGVAVEAAETARLDLAELRRTLEALDDLSAREADSGWRFFDPLAVGAGPRGHRGDATTQGPSDGREEHDPKEDPGAGMPEDAANGLGAGEESSADSEMGTAIWSVLVGWRATSGVGSDRTRRRFLEFDEHTGRFD